MKVCKWCSVLLVEGDNWRSSSKKISNYKCNSCCSKQVGKWQVDNREDHYVYLNKWKEDNREQWLSIIKKSNKKNTKYRLDKNKETNNSLGAGVYGFKYNNKWLYVGESKTIYKRWKSHISIPSQAYSPVSILLTEGKINKEGLEFEVLEEVNDKQIRKKRETYWIEKLKPVLNKSKVDVISNYENTTK